MLMKCVAFRLKKLLDNFLTTVFDRDMILLISDIHDLKIFDNAIQMFKK